MQSILSPGDGAGLPASSARERRWVVITTSGQHVTLGRHSDPTADEVEAAEQSLAKQGLAGWLAVVEGDYWSKRGKLTVLMVRALAHPVTEFDAAVAAFEDARQRAHQSV